MRVVFFETTNLSPHLETSLELARRHIDDGDEVYYYFIGNLVVFNELLKRENFFLQLCRPERKIHELLGKKVKYIEPKRALHSYDSYFPNHFSDISHLRNFKYKEYNAGLACLSSLISHTRSCNPDLKKNRKLIRSIINSGISVYEFVLGELGVISPDLIYFFNGRFALNKAIHDAALEQSIPFLIHERGANKFRYFVNPWMPHDIDRIKESIHSHWHGASDLIKTSEAKNFFNDARNRKELGWKSCSSLQEINRLPIIPKNKKIITYFSTSEHEYAAVGDVVKWNHWPDQMSAVKDLIEVISKNKDIFLFIRLHPNKAIYASSDLDNWLSLELPVNAKLILPDDPVDSYALMECSNLTVTVGSSTGIESVYWGTPSVCLGPSLYSDIGAVYLPSDKVELAQMILDESLQVNSERALPYGFYMATFGEEFVYYQPETLFKGRFMGVNLQSFGLCKYLRAALSLPFRIVRKLFRLLNGRINHA